MSAAVLLCMYIDVIDSSLMMIMPVTMLLVMVKAVHFASAVFTIDPASCLHRIAGHSPSSEL